MVSCTFLGIKIDTDDKYNPIRATDGIVCAVFFITALFHILNAIFCIEEDFSVGFQDNVYWIVFHSVSAFLAAYWPYMILTKLTHGGFGHASYPLIFMNLHFRYVQAWSVLLLVDKIVNWNGLKWPWKGPDGEIYGVLGSYRELNSYGVDNLLVDHVWIPKCIIALSVNFFVFVGLSILDFFQLLPEQVFWSYIGLCAFAAFEIFTCRHPSEK